MCLCPAVQVLTSRSFLVIESKLFVTEGSAIKT